MIRVGIIGAGLIGSVHSAALRELIAHGVVDASVVAIYDTDPARAAVLAAHHGAIVPEDVDALLDQVDAVWVCTWTDGHLDLVARAAARGIAVFCEKPLAPTWDDAVAVAAALALVPHRVGLVLRTSPVFRNLAAQLEEGAHGVPLATVFRDDQYFPIRGLYGSTWRADVAKAGGGTLLEHSIHDVDLLRWFLGDPRTVTASIGRHFGHEGIDDTASVLLDYEGPSAATLVSVWHAVDDRPSSRRLEVFCESAVYVATDDRLGPLFVETTGGVEEIAGALPEWADDFDGGDLAIGIAHYAVASEEFLSDLAGGRTPRGPGAVDALAAHRIVEAAYRSAAAGGIPIDPESLKPSGSSAD